MHSLARIFLTLAASCFLCLARADITLKQDIINTNSLGTTSVKVTILIKGRKVRFNAGDFISIILDLDSGNEMKLVHPQKLCLLTTQAKEIQRALNESALSGERTKPKPELHRSGKKQTISGYETEEYTWHSETSNGSFWIAMNIPDGRIIHEAIDAIAKPTRLTSSIPVFDDINGVTIRAENHVTIKPPENAPPEVLKDWDGKTSSTGTIVAISRDSIDENAFTIPAGYEIDEQ